MATKKIDIKSFIKDELLDLNIKDKKYEIDNQTLEYLLNHDECKNNEVSLEELKQNLYLIKSSVDDIDACKNSNQEKCINYLGYHSHVDRINNRLMIVAKKCPKQEQFENRYFYKKNFIYDSFKEQDISKVLINSNYFKDNVDISVKRIANEFKEMIKNNNLHGLYIYGDFGIGKTYLCMGMANEISKQLDKKICFINMTDMTSRIKRLFDFKEELNSFIETLKRTDVLFIDDIGSEQASEWLYNSFLLEIMNERMYSNKPTFFNSNLSLKELEEYIQRNIKNEKNSKIVVGRLLDRIKSLVKNKDILMKGINRRL